MLFILSFGFSFIYEDQDSCKFWLMGMIPLCFAGLAPQIVQLLIFLFFKLEAIA